MDVEGHDAVPGVAVALNPNKHQKNRDLEFAFPFNRSIQYPTKEMNKDSLHPPSPAKQEGGEAPVP